MTISRPRVWILFVLWLGAIALAMTIDRPVAQWVQENRPLDQRTSIAHRSGNHPIWLTKIVRLPGNYGFVLPVGIVIGLFHRKRWIAAAPILLSGPLVGVTYLVIKWMVGRRRPVIELAPFTFHPFINGISGLFKSVSGLAFPSGDATMAFAAAACMAVAIPQWTAAFFAWAVLVSVERVLENAHYVSDVVAGAGLGVLCALTAVLISKKIFSVPESHGFEVSNPRAAPENSQLAE
ncbi:MAG TPA: phosphatase PAP2 family protein [Tepidisphaeraceae bacterium]|jgi:membrane-associated phospholipid phosphatase